MLGVYISSKTIDVIQVGLNRSKMAMIITNREEEVRHAVLNKIDRGLRKYQRSEAIQMMSGLF